MSEKFFRRGDEKLVFIGPQSKIDELLAAGWIEVQNLNPTVDESRALKLSETKAEAKRRIIALFPNATLENYRDKELSSLMRGSVLLKKKEAGAISASEQAELDALDAKAARLQGISAMKF